MRGESKFCEACGQVFFRPSQGCGARASAARRFCSVSCSSRVTRPRDVGSRLLDNSIPEPNSGCWIWLAAVTERGYGQMSVGGRQQGAHRASYEFYKGPVPAGAVVRHSCDNPFCINPDHLLIGSALDNVHDALDRGRFVSGNTHPIAKLTVEAVKEIRSSTLSDAKLAKKFGVSAAAIGYARRGESWRSVR